MSWFSKKEPVPVKLPTPKRISVHLNDGRTVVHYARYRTLRDGTLTLHDSKDGGYVIADYVHGAWWSCTVGKRSVSKPEV